MLFDEYRCHRGRVLLIDNELHPETLAHRIPAVAEMLGLRPDQYADMIDVIPLRGNLCSIDHMLPTFDQCRGRYQLIILDARLNVTGRGCRERE